jgi:rod shape-determining protein MreD
MGAPAHRSVEVFRVHPATLGVTAFAALLLQTVLPLKIPLARLFDFPLLVTIYFSLLRRNKIFGIGLGTGIGLLQDALSHSYIGIFGMAKALVGFLAASASVKFDFEQLAPRFVLAGILIFVHSIYLFGLERFLLEPPPPFRPLDMLSGVLVNVALGLVLFQVLDYFKRPA